MDFRCNNAEAKQKLIEHIESFLHKDLLSQCTIPEGKHFVPLIKNMKTTTTIVIGEERVTNKNKIELIKFISMEKGIADVNKDDEYHHFLELICRNYDDDGYDLIFGYDNPNESAENTAKYCKTKCVDIQIS